MNETEIELFSNVRYTYTSEYLNFFILRIADIRIEFYYVTKSQLFIIKGPLYYWPLHQ